MLLGRVESLFFCFFPCKREVEEVGGKPLFIALVNKHTFAHDISLSLLTFFTSQLWPRKAPALSIVCFCNLLGAEAQYVLCWVSGLWWLYSIRCWSFPSSLLAHISRTWVVNTPAKPSPFLVLYYHCQPYSSERFGSLMGGNFPNFVPSPELIECKELLKEVRKRLSTVLPNSSSLYGRSVETCFIVYIWWAWIIGADFMTSNFAQRRDICFSRHFVSRRDWFLFSFLFIIDLSLHFSSAVDLAHVQ